MGRGNQAQAFGDVLGSRRGSGSERKYPDEARLSQFQDDVLCSLCTLSPSDSGPSNLQAVVGEIHDMSLSGSRMTPAAVAEALAALEHWGLIIQDEDLYRPSAAGFAIFDIPRSEQPDYMKS